MKVVIVTSSRADFGLLEGLIRNLSEDPNFEVDLLVTGSHLSKSHGDTREEILLSGFTISQTIDTLDKVKNVEDAAFVISKVITETVEFLQKSRPDLVMILGDRYEILGVVIASNFCNVPLAHIHGGEITEGSFDDNFRHAITKMSHLHFVANEHYRKRVIQLGEQPSSVFSVGGMGVDRIQRTELLTKSEVEFELGIKFRKKSLLITYHPETIRSKSSDGQIDEILSAVGSLQDTTLIFTKPGADPGADTIYDSIVEFCKSRDDSHFFPSLGTRLYLSCIKQVDGVLGNSSSGITEVPSFRKGTINVGSRQKGRIQAKSVINCEAREEALKEAIQLLYSPKFQSSLSSVRNPYGEAGSSIRIHKILKNLETQNLFQKKFFDR